MPNIWKFGAQGDAPAPNNSGNSGDKSNSGNQDNKNNNDNNNNNNNVDPNMQMVDTIWDEIKKDPKDQNDKNNNNQQQQQQQSDPQKDVDTYLAGIGLGEYKLTEQELEAFKSGEGVQSAFDNINKRIRDSHIKAVSAANTLLEKKIPELVEAAVNKSKSFYQGEQLRDLLQERLPWTRDPVIAPMAETILRQLLIKGATHDQGIEGTKKYFERVQKAMDPSYIAPNKNTNQPYRGQRPQETGNMDWMKVLSPGNN